MRCYHLNNFYLSGIHAGIQTAHAQHELAMKYVHPLDCSDNTEAADSYVNWAVNHKTIIVLNAGMQSALIEWEEFLQSGDHPYAWASFREAEDALNGALTNIGLVLPAKMYSMSRDILKAVASMGHRPPVGYVVAAVDTPTMKVDVFQAAEGSVLVVRHMCDQSDTLAQVAETWTYTPYELDLMARLSRCSLM